MIGIKANRFNSMEIQANSQLELDSAISVLISNTERNNIEDGIICNIRAWRN
jgi:hypothetical protein